jgi:hypothetical protein
MGRTVNQTGNTNADNEYNNIRIDAENLALHLFKSEAKQKAEFVNRLLDTYSQAKGKDILIIHNPGGSGSTDIEHLIYWERSVVEGIKTTLTAMGYTWALVQYFRSGNNWKTRLPDVWEQIRYHLTGKIFKAQVVAAEIDFLSKQFNNLKIIQLGVSQGAAFGNSVMRHLGLKPHVYSIELGIFFAQLNRRVVTENTLAIDNNGLVTDPIVHFSFKRSAKAYITAPYRWLKSNMSGKPVKFTYCINVPGHEYLWENPHVGAVIEKFLNNKLGFKSNT